MRVTLCIRCGRALEHPRWKLCPTCRANRCRYCAAPPEPGHALCRRHLLYMREHTRTYNRLKRQRCKQAGICVVCMKRPVTKGAMCERCRRRKSRKEGLMAA